MTQDARHVFDRRSFGLYEHHRLRSRSSSLPARFRVVWCHGLCCSRGFSFMQGERFCTLRSLLFRSKLKSFFFSSERENRRATRCGPEPCVIIGARIRESGNRVAVGQSVERSKEESIRPLEYRLSRTNTNTVRSVRCREALNRWTTSQWNPSKPP